MSWTCPTAAHRSKVDEHGATGTVGVDITAGNVDEAPCFPAWETGRRSVPENAATAACVTPVFAEKSCSFMVTKELGYGD